MQAAQFANHSIWNQVTESLDFLDRVRVEATPDEMIWLSEIRLTLDRLQSYEDADVASWLTDDLVNPIYNAMGNLNVALSNMQSQRNAYLPQARAGAEQVLTALSRWPLPVSPKSAVAQSRAVFARYKDDVEQSLSTLAEQSRKIHVTSQAREEAATVVFEEIRSQVEVLKSNLTSMQSRIGEDESRLTRALTDHSTAFLDSQTAQSATFNKWLQRMEDTFAELALPHTEKLAQAALDGEDALNDINTLRTDTHNAAGLATGAILADSYKTHAEQDRRAGYMALGAAVGLVFVGVVVLIFLFGTTPMDHELPTQAIALKLGISLALGGVATVLFRLSKTFFTSSANSKETELELRAIGPFLSDITEKEQADEAKLQFISRKFGQAKLGQKTSDDIPSNDIVKSVLDLASGALARKP